MVILCCRVTVQRHHSNDTSDDHFVCLSMVIAVVVALFQYSKVPVLRHICRFYVWVIRGTPLLVQLYVVFFGLPSIGIMVDAFLAAVIVFSINEGAYNAETIRGALESVPQG